MSEWIDFERCQTAKHGAAGDVFEVTNEIRPC